MKRSKRLSGFTFIEIVAAIAILAVGILAVLTIFPVGIESSKKAAVRTKATLLGEMKMEELRATKTFGDLGNVAKTNFPAAEDPEQSYQYKVDVSAATLKTDGSTDKLKKVVVSVFWPAKESDENKQQRMDFTTLVGNR